MVKTSSSSESAASDHIFVTAAALFGAMAAPIRLKIISALCQEEKNVTQLLEVIPTTQPNMSQHLNTLFTAGVIAKRREGVQIFYRVENEKVAAICREVCTQIALE